MPLLSLPATSRERPMTLSHSNLTCALELEPEELAVVELLHELGVGEQRLGGDAAPVEADAPQLGAFDAGDFVAELGGPDGSDIARRPAADDHEIEVLVRHG